MRVADIADHMTLSAKIQRLQDLSPIGANGLDLTSETCRQYMFLHSGGGRMTIAGASHTLAPGELAVAPCGAHVRLWLDPGARGVLMAATEAFLRSRVLPVLYVPTGDHWRRYGLPRVAPLAVGRANQGVRNRIQNELEQAAERLGGLCDAAVIAYAFVILGSAGPGTPPPAQPSEPPAAELAPAQLVMRYWELIENNFRRRLSIEDYAEQLAVTPVRLGRACKNTMNRTPLSLVHERIIVEAKGELSFSQKSVAEIAYGLGFVDAAYFNRFFKQHTGEPPLQYRRSELSQRERGDTARQTGFAAGATERLDR